MEAVFKDEKVLQFFRKFSKRIQEGDPEVQNSIIKFTVGNLMKDKEEEFAPLRVELGKFKGVDFAEFAVPARVNA